VEDLAPSFFIPRFSAAALIEQVSYIADRVQVFCEKYRSNVGRKIGPLYDFGTRFTFEVIMKISL